MQSCCTTLLAIVLGLGVHMSKEVLGPAEPALRDQGVGPIIFALINIAPTAMGFITPLLWGKLWDRRVELVLVGAPLGELVGAALIAFGLHCLYKSRDDGALPGGIALVCGLLASSACRAGIAVAEFVAIGQGCGGSAFAFTSLVMAKHANGMLMAWIVPQIIGSTAHQLNGLLRVQLWTLLPHFAALLAGIAMAARHVGAKPIRKSGNAQPHKGPTPQPVPQLAPQPDPLAASELPELAPPRRRRRVSREIMVLAGTAHPGASVHATTTEALASALSSTEALSDADGDADGALHADEIEVEATHDILERVSSKGRQLVALARGASGDALPKLSMTRSASKLEKIAHLLLPTQHLYVIGAPPGSNRAHIARCVALTLSSLARAVLLGAWRALAIGTLHSYHVSTQRL